MVKGLISSPSSTTRNTTAHQDDDAVKHPTANQLDAEYHVPTPHKGKKEKLKQDSSLEKWRRNFAVKWSSIYSRNRHSQASSSHDNQPLSYQTSSTLNKPGDLTDASSKHPEGGNGPSRPPKSHSQAFRSLAPKSQAAWSPFGFFGSGSREILASVDSVTSNSKLLFPSDPTKNLGSFPCSLKSDISLTSQGGFDKDTSTGVVGTNDHVDSPRIYDSSSQRMDPSGSIGGGGGKLWVGALVPEIVIDYDGVFSFILAQVGDSLAGCQRLLLRARWRLNSSQLFEDLKAELARVALENDLPVQTSVVLLSSGTLSIGGRQVFITCNFSGFPVPIPRTRARPATANPRVYGHSGVLQSGSGGLGDGGEANMGIGGGAVLVPNVNDTSVGFCQSSQPIWSAHRDPSFGHGIFEFISDTEVTFNWYKNVDGNAEPADSVLLQRNTACRLKSHND